MNKIIVIIIILFGILVSSCEYDNYEGPSMTFSGQLKNDGANFLYDGNPGKPLFVLIQKGYGKPDGGTDLYVDQEGHYQQLLFKDATYYLTLRNAQFPFEMPNFKSKGVGLGYDSIKYDISQNITQEFEVIPYYKISDVNSVVEGNNIVTTFNIQKNPAINGVLPLVKTAYFYLSTSNKVNSGTRCVRSVSVSSTNQTTARITMPLNFYRVQYPQNYRDYGFFRVAIELVGVPENYLFSDVKKIEGLPL